MNILKIKVIINKSKLILRNNGASKFLDSGVLLQIRSELKKRDLIVRYVLAIVVNLPILKIHNHWFVMNSELMLRLISSEDLHKWTYFTTFTCHLATRKVMICQLNYLVVCLSLCKCTYLCTPPLHKYIHSRCQNPKFESWF